MKICFFVKTNDKSIFDRVEFYAQDLRILRDLGHEVQIATTWSEIPWDADLYFAWWWTYAFLPLLKARLRGKALIVIGTFDHIMSPKGGPFNIYYQKPFYKQWLMRLGLRFASENVFFDKEEAEELPKLMPCPNAHYIPLTIDSQTYSPIDDPKENFLFSLCWLEKKNVERKCILEIIEATALIREHEPSIKLVISGKEDNAMEDINALIEKLSLQNHVTVTGAISLEQKLDYLRRCKVYVQPTHFEGFGLAILEAMACGAAVVTNPVGAVRDVVADAGVLLDNYTPQHIAERVIDLLQNPTEIEVIGKKAQERAVTLFSYQSRLQAIGALIRKYECVRL